MPRPRRQIYTMDQYLKNEKDGFISNNAGTQRNPKWKAIIDGLAITILTDDYIPPIILFEEECGQKTIVDGGSRTAAFRMLEAGSYKVKSSVDDPIIPYKKMEKGEDGKPVWTDAEFDIRNKTFNQFPEELKRKFYEYQVETVIHEGNETIDVKAAHAKYLKRYNLQTGMSANEQLFINIPNFADEIRGIIKNRFFLDCSVFSEPEKDKGVLERVVAESVMLMFHFDKWNKNGKKLAKYLNDNGTSEEFKIFDENVVRLENIITKDIRELFNAKNTFVYMTLFNEFTKTHLPDEKFAEFLRAFNTGLRNKEVEGKCFDSLDLHSSTKDKSVISSKLHILETLMNEFLHIEETEKVATAADIVEEKTESSSDNSLLKFVKENADPDATDEDVELFSDMAEDCFANNGIRCDSPVYQKCKAALTALLGYACRKDQDRDVEEWFSQYKDEIHHGLYKKSNYTYMKNSFDNFINKGAIA